MPDRTPIRGPGSNQHADKPPRIDHSPADPSRRAAAAAAVTAEPDLDGDSPASKPATLEVCGKTVTLPKVGPDDYWVISGSEGVYSTVEWDDVHRVCAEHAGVIEERDAQARGDDGVGYTDWHIDETGLRDGDMSLSKWDLDETDRDIAENFYEHGGHVDYFVNGPTDRFASQGDAWYEQALRKYAKTYSLDGPDDDPVDPDGPLAAIEQAKLADPDDIRLYPDSSGRLHLYRDPHDHFFRDL